MKLYVFGKEYDNMEQIKAKNADMAINLFKVNVLFPEEYVYKKYIKSYDYNSILGRYIYDIKEGATIPVYEFDINNKESKYHEIKEKKLKPIRTISLAECINVNFKQLERVKFLTYDGNIKEEENSLSHN